MTKLESHIVTTAGILTWQAVNIIPHIFVVVKILKEFQRPFVISDTGELESDGLIGSNKLR